MKCPACQSKELYVVDSRKHASHVFRRKECRDCLTRFNTKETIVFSSLDEYIQNKILSQ